jgi:hypothetical protein
MQADNSTLGPNARPHPGRIPRSLRAGANGRALGPGGRLLDDLNAAVRREVYQLADGVNPELLDQLQRQWREQGLVPPADAAGLLAAHARDLHARAATDQYPRDTTQQVRIGVRFNQPDAQSRWYRLEETSVRSTPAGPTIAADHIDRTIDAARATAPQVAHLSGYAGQEHADAQRARAPDIAAATTVDEHHEGLTEATATQGAADQDAQRSVQHLRWAQTFPELTVVQATVPHLANRQPAPIIPAKQKGRAR